MYGLKSFSLLVYGRLILFLAGFYLTSGSVARILLANSKFGGATIVSLLIVLLPALILFCPKLATAPRIVLENVFRLFAYVWPIVICTAAGLLAYGSLYAKGGSWLDRHQSILVDLFVSLSCIALSLAIIVLFAACRSGYRRWYEIRNFPKEISLIYCVDILIRLRLDGRRRVHFGSAYLNRLEEVAQCLHSVIVRRSLKSDPQTATWAEATAGECASYVRKLKTMVILPLQNVSLSEVL